MIRRGRKSDINVLARIHLRELPLQFLPSLGEKFLQLLYANLLQNKETIIYVSENDNLIQGYIVGAKDFNYVFKIIILKNFIQYFSIIFPQILKKPRIFMHTLETLFYTKKNKAYATDSELVVIAILKRFHRKGIGRNLISALEESFLSQGITRYKVSVTANNQMANLFYKSLGFKKNHELFLYGQRVYLYSKKIL